LRFFCKEGAKKGITLCLHKSNQKALMEPLVCCFFSKAVCFAAQRLHLFWSVGMLLHLGVFERAQSFFLQSQQ
jgi:hypothetical protein